MRLQGGTAFVLHARPWRESSVLVEVLSVEQGRLGLLARGLASPKRHLLRAALQPWQQIRFDAELRGELATLRHAEALDAAPRLQGDAALAGFYVHELLIRLLARHDPHPGAVVAYAQLRARLASGQPPAWPLRQFERDLLQALGVGLPLSVTAEGEALDPQRAYRVEADAGLIPALRSGEGALGEAWMALEADACPPPDLLRSLRGAMRDWLRQHLGGRPLEAWRLYADLGAALTPRE